MCYLRDLLIIISLSLRKIGRKGFMRSSLVSITLVVVLLLSPGAMASGASEGNLTANVNTDGCMAAAPFVASAISIGHNALQGVHNPAMSLPVVSVPCLADIDKLDQEQLLGLSNSLTQTNLTNVRFVSANSQRTLSYDLLESTRLRVRILLNLCHFQPLPLVEDLKCLTVDELQAVANLVLHATANTVMVTQKSFDKANGEGRLMEIVSTRTLARLRIAIEDEINNPTIVVPVPTVRQLTSLSDAELRQTLDALSLDGKCWYVSLASFNGCAERKDYKTVKPATVLLVRERTEAQLHAEVIEVPSISVVNQLSLTELRDLDASLRRENVEFVPACQWQANNRGQFMRTAELANVQARVQERISGMSTRERDDTPTYGQVCDAVEEHLNKFADKLQINYTGDLADLVLTEHAERAQDFVSIVEAGRDMRQDILDNIRSPTCICSVCYCELSKRELSNMGNIIAGVTGHVLAFKQNVPDDLLQLFYPLPPDRLPEIIQMVLIAPTDDINHAKALAQKCPAFIVRGELLYMWCIAITQALERIGDIPNVQVRFLRRTAEAYRARGTHVPEVIVENAVCTGTEEEAQELLKYYGNQTQGYTEPSRTESHVPGNDDACDMVDAMLPNTQNPPAMPSLPSQMPSLPSQMPSLPSQTPSETTASANMQNIHAEPAAHHNMAPELTPEELVAIETEVFNGGYMAGLHDVDMHINALPEYQVGTAIAERLKFAQRNVDTLNAGGILALAESNKEIFSDYDRMWPILAHPTMFPNLTGARPHGMSHETWVDITLRRPRDQFQRNPLFIMDMFDIVQRHQVNTKTSLYLKGNPQAERMLNEMSLDDTKECLEILAERATNPTRANTRLQNASAHVKEMHRSVRIAGANIIGSPQSLGKIRALNEASTNMNGHCTTFVTLNMESAKSSLCIKACGVDVTFDLNGIAQNVPATQQERWRLVTSNPCAAARFAELFVEPFCYIYSDLNKCGSTATAVERPGATRCVLYIVPCACPAIPSSKT
jgi:hypothetical protein